MKNSRREFLGMSLMLGLSSVMSADPLRGILNDSESDYRLLKSENKLKILILGGTSFLGPHQIAYALERGHEVSTFTRGKTKPKIHPELFDRVEQLVGDRENDLEAMKNKEWDVVIDNSGRKVKWTEDTAKLLVDKVGLYMYTSSVSVYYPFTGDDFSESRPLVMAVPEDVGEDEKPTYGYGVMKANSEKAAIDTFGKDRSIIVRPHLIVGPGDPTNRFPYWLARVEKGGDFIIPGAPDEPIQYIDVRDLAQWMIRLAENKAAGIYNGAGPGFDLTTNSFVHGIHANYNVPINYIQIDDQEFLRENEIMGIQPWVIQLPKYAGMSRTNKQKAIASGLTFRSLSDTVRATRDWWYSDAVSQERRDGILNGERSFMRREPEILKKWRAR